MPSSEKVISPGVFTNEIDQTFLPAAVGDIGAALIGPTVKGPPLIPTVVNSYSEYEQIFGSTFTAGTEATDTAAATADEGVECGSGGDDIVGFLVSDDTPLQDKDPYDGGNAFVGSKPDSKPEGNTILTGTATEINITTQYSKTETDLLENTVVIE